MPERLTVMPITEGLLDVLRDHTIESTHDHRADDAEVSQAGNE